MGVKSSSLHPHFPTKEDLAAAALRRWEETARFFDAHLERDFNPIRVLTEAFRGAAFSDEPMRPRTSLGAAARDLWHQVAAEEKGFFAMCECKLFEGDLSRGDAARVFSTITGARILANGLGIRPNAIA